MYVVFNDLKVISILLGQQCRQKKFPCFLYESEKENNIALRRYDKSEKTLYLGVKYIERESMVDLKEC